MNEPKIEQIVVIDKDGNKHTIYMIGVRIFDWSKPGYSDSRLETLGKRT